MMKRFIMAGVIFLSLMCAGIVVPIRANAAVAAGCDKSAALLGLPAWYKYLDIGPKDGDPCAVIGPLDSNGKFDIAIGGARIGLAIVDILLRLAAIIAVIFVLYGGIRYILSQGEPDHTKRARGTVINALIGLVVTMLATAAVNFLGNTLTK